MGDEYPANYPKADWTFLEAGALINFAEEDNDLELISRATREDDAT